LLPTSGLRYEVGMGAERGNDPARLIQEIARGDREAFERFYDRYASLVYTLALRILRVRRCARSCAGLCGYPRALGEVSAPTGPTVLVSK
jgi:hypothetical protein